MNLAESDIHQWIDQGRMQIAESGEEPLWLSELREAGSKQLNDLPVPTRRQEAWRYTPTYSIVKQAFKPQLTGSFGALELSDIEHLFLDVQTHRLVFVNGVFNPDLSDKGDLPKGLEIESLRQYQSVPNFARSLIDAGSDAGHVFSALNKALVSDGAVIHLGKGSQAERPIEVLHISVGMDEPQMVHPRHMLVLDQEAEAMLIERYYALGDSNYFSNAGLDIYLHAKARLIHQRVQEESTQAHHINDLNVYQQADSRYECTQLSFGSAWSRSDIAIRLQGEGAQASVNGLLLAKDEQLTDMHLKVMHEVANCESEERVKGLLDGKGSIVFDGHIRVEKDAQKTDAQLSNDNLMLSRKADVNSKPQLEIYADDVKCSHGTTVGELDSDMLFYLRSRGIPEEQARMLLCQGFAQDVIDELSSEHLQQQAIWTLRKRLEVQS